MGVLMRKKLLSLLLAVSVLFSVFSVTAAAAGEETEIFTLPVTLGDEIRVDNERNEIYFVPQFFNVEDLFALLMEADPTLDFDIDAGSLKNGMYLVSGVTVTVYQGDPSENRVYTVRVKGDLSGEGRTTANEARQALRLSVGLDEDLFESCFRALDAATPIVVVPSSFNSITEEELAAHGVNIVIYANQLTRSAFPAMQQTAQDILRYHRAKEVDDRLMPIKQIITLIDEL